MPATLKRIAERLRGEIRNLYLVWQSTRSRALGDNDESADAERFITALYRGILRREPDPQGLENFSQALRRGASHLVIVERFLNSDEFRQKAAAGLFAPPGHFYSPIVDPKAAAQHLDAREKAGVPEALPGIRLDRAEMVQTWNELLPFLTTAPFPDDENQEFRYAYNNDAYSFGDGSVLHAMLRWRRPKRLIEIGSGWSSACTYDTVERFLDGGCQLTFIEPYPKLLRERLHGVTDVRILDKPVQQVALQVFDELAADDILFIDSTHVLRTGSDVCFELFEILPRLKPGVLVHVHDIFWPFEYPRIWAVDENRSWNELYALHAYLMNNEDWRIVFFADYFVQHERSLIEATCPTFLRNPGGALWLQRS